MFRKKCALSSDKAWKRFYPSELHSSILSFFFVLIGFFYFPSFLLSASADEAIPVSTAFQSAPASEITKPTAAANVSSFNKPTTQVVVNITVNGESKGDFFIELDEEGELFIRVEDLETLKLHVAEGRIVLLRGERYAPVSAVLDVKHTFDEKNLNLTFTGKTTGSQKIAVDVFPLRSKPQNVYYPRETSAFLNYGLTYAYTNPLGFQSFSGTSKLGIRSGDVFFVSDSLYTKTETMEQSVRLQSSITYERRNDLQWFVLGDQFANSGDLGSTVNMGGIGFSKVYKIDPYFITQPVFDLKGAAIFPSQAEIYMDGVLMSKQSIVPGSFDLKNIYSYAGAHTVDVVLKDPFGNEQRISAPMYFNSLMLRDGLHEYSYDAGFIRKQYGVDSNEYGKPVFSAFHRYGITSSLNIGARGEVFDGIYNVGVSTAVLAPRAGSFSLSVAESTANGKRGQAVSFQHSYQIGSFSMNFLMRGFSRDYAVISAPSTTDTTKYETIFGTGFFLMPLGSISLGYSKTATYGGVTTQITSASYSLGLSKSTSLFMTASSTRVVDTTYSVFVGLNYVFGKNVRGAASYNKAGSTDTESVQIQKDVPVGEGLGYRATANRSSTGSAITESFSPFAQYNARYGIYSLDSSIQHSSGAASESYAISAAGSIVYAGGFYGISRPVSDSFGIVMVDTLPNAMVLNNGQEIGKTDASGMMIVPTLTSYNQNQITLDVKNIPMEYTVSGVNAVLSPSLWSGFCLSFNAHKIKAVTGTVSVKKDDKKVPLEYTEITMIVGEKELTFPTGKGGEFYIENLVAAEAPKSTQDNLTCRAIAEHKKFGSTIQPGSYRASVDYDGRTCRFNIIFPVTEDVITDLGEIQCVVSAASSAVNR